MNKNAVLVFVMAAVLVGGTAFGAVVVKFYNENGSLNSGTYLSQQPTGGTELSIVGTAKVATATRYVSVGVDPYGWDLPDQSFPSQDKVNLTITNVGSSATWIRNVGTNQYFYLVPGQSLNQLVSVNSVTYENYWGVGSPRWSVFFYKEYTIQVLDSGTPIDYDGPDRMLNPNTNGRQSVSESFGIPDGVYTNLRIKYDSATAGRDITSDPFGVTIDTSAPPPPPPPPLPWYCRYWPYLSQCQP